MCSATRERRRFLTSFQVLMLVFGGQTKLAERNTAESDTAGTLDCVNSRGAVAYE